MRYTRRRLSLYHLNKAKEQDLRRLLTWLGLKELPDSKDELLAVADETEWNLSIG